MKSKTSCLFLHLTFLCFTIITFICCTTIFSLHCSAKTAKPKWKKEISSLQIGKTYQYRIKCCPKKASVQFTSNHASRAAINRKTGLLRAKKKGTVLITAKISLPHNKTKKLKTKLLITKKKITEKKQVKSTGLSINIAENNSSILNYVHFSAAESINPWNHSIMLYSSRILLPSEIQNTDLTLIPLTTKSNSKMYSTLNAHFSSLSPDGKTITYQLNEESAKILCPGNGTLDGEYKITSSFFSESLQTTYHERIQLNSISGFVLNSDQKSLSHVSVKLYADSQNVPLAVTTTDQNGYYQFQNITEDTIRLEAALENYETYSQSSLHLAGQNICQNIILHPTSTDNLAVSCRILDEQSNPMENATVILTTEDAASTTETSKPTNNNAEKFFLQGLVDHNGMICFSNQKAISTDGYTQIAYHANQSTPKFISAEMPASDSIICNSAYPLTRHQEYTLYVFPATDGTTIPKDYQIESFSFSFSSFLSDQLFLQIHLQKLPLLSSKEVTISRDTLTDPVSSFHYKLYDKHGKTLFQTVLSSLSKNTSGDYSNQLTTALQYNKVRLPDGDYYAAVTAYDDTIPTEQISSSTEDFSSRQVSTESETAPFGQVSSGTSLLPVQICNSEITSANFTLSPCQTFRTLVYTDYQDESLENISFILYQKLDTSYFPIETYHSDLFSPVHSGQRAYLDLPVLTGASYLLEPANTEYKISAGASFQISVEQNKTLSSSIPEHQILFDKIPNDTNSTKSEQDLSYLSDYTTLCTSRNSFSAEYFSHSVTYPNTVYAYYQTDGTFTTFLFATPAFSSPENLSSSLICNQLQNDMMIQTSQKSYSAAPFFVT